MGSRPRTSKSSLISKRSATGTAPSSTIWAIATAGSWTRKYFSPPAVAVEDIELDDLPVGSNVIVASYVCDTSHMAVKSAPVTIQIVAAAPSFTLLAAQSATNGTAGLLQLNLVANSTFAGNGQLGCSGLPTGSSCAFSPSSLSLASNGTASVHVSISNGTTAHLESSRAGSRLLPAAQVAAAFLFVHFSSDTEIVVEYRPR